MSASITRPLLAAVASLAVTGAASANLLINAGFDEPDASAGDVFGPPTDWDGFNQNFTSAAFSRDAGGQALKQFGQDAGAFQTFAATPDSSWSISAYVFMPSVDKAAGATAGFLQIQFLDASQNVITVASVEVINANSAADTWTLVQMPNAPAVAGTAFVRPLLFTGPYSATPGPGGNSGSIWWDDVVFEQAVPEPASLAMLAAGGCVALLRRRS